MTNETQAAISQAPIRIETDEAFIEHIGLSVAQAASVLGWSRNRFKSRLDSTPSRNSALGLGDIATLLHHITVSEHSFDPIAIQSYLELKPNIDNEAKISARRDVVNRQLSPRTIVDLNGVNDLYICLPSFEWLDKEERERLELLSKVRNIFKSVCSDFTADNGVPNGDKKIILVSSFEAAVRSLKDEVMPTEHPTNNQSDPIPGYTLLYDNGVDMYMPMVVTDIKGGLTTVYMASQKGNLIEAPLYNGKYLLSDVPLLTVAKPK